MGAQEFQGVCPLCYRPIKSSEEIKTVQSMDREETYHSLCLLDWVKKNTPERADTQGIGMTLLEEHKKVFIGHSMQKRETYMTTKYFEWKAHGEHFKMQREEHGIALKHIASAMGVSTARLKRFEAGEPVRDAKLLTQGYVSLLYIYHLEQRLKVSTAQIENNQATLHNAICLYEEMQSDLAQLSSASLSPEGAERT